MAGNRVGTALDEATFGPMSEALRRDLLLHCYRFTGSVHDAEDLVQETLIKAWGARADYRGEAGLRTWLRRIATRVCLDALRRNPARRTLPSRTGAEGPEAVLWLEPLPDDLLADAEADPAAVYDLRESVSLAFLVALQNLPPRRRAVLILRDVLAMRASEAAELLEMSVPAVNTLLHRARRRMRAGYVRPAVRDRTDTQAAGLLRRYIAAWQAGDVDALLSLLKADAALEMPPIPAAAIGATAIRAFLAPQILDGRPGRWRGVTTEANGGPAVALYERSPDGWRFTGLQLIGIDHGKITSVTAYMDGSIASRFRLPPMLPADDPDPGP